MASVGANQKTILAVDDNNLNLLILQKLLTPHFRVVVARSGEEALTEAGAERPDLVLLDIMMPGLDGYGTCQRMRDDPALRWTKIIMVSAMGQVAERLRAYEIGADDYLTKPFDHDELLAKVRVHLRLKSVEELDELKTQLLTMLSHETRTPLTSLLAPAEMLAEDLPIEPTERQRLAGMIVRSSVHLRNIFDRVVTLSAYKAGGVTFAPQTVDLAGIARSVVAALLEQAREWDVRLEEVAAAQPCPVSADPAHLRVLVQSLVTHAIENGVTGSAIRGSVEHDGATVRLAVAYAQLGLPDGDLGFLFEEFASADVAHHHAGTSLLLAIARQLAVGHRGRITARRDGAAALSILVTLPAAG